jgi:hypothetical protein
VENWDRPKDELIPNSDHQEDQPAKKSKKKSKLRQAIGQSKPIFDPSMRKILPGKKLNLIFRRKIFRTIFR